MLAQQLPPRVADVKAVSSAPVRPRVAVLLIPQFFVDVCLRENASLAGRPLAVADGIARREIIAVNASAQSVQLGMTPKQARAACPGLVVIARNEKAERVATHELLEALESCSPEVEAQRPGVYFFDAKGLPGGETAATGAAVALAAALGFGASAAVADDKFTAYCAAVTAGGCSLVPAGGSAAFLAPLPVALLPLAPGDAERFEMLGLRNLGQIAALPQAPLAARFGERARRYARVARGEDREPLQPRRAQTVYEERFAFESAVDRLEPLFFALRGCLAGVAGRLAGAAQVCDRVDIILVLDPCSTLESPAHDAAASSPITIPVALAEPTASAAVMFDLVRIALESRAQLGAVEAIIIRAAPSCEPPPQLGLFDGSVGSRGTALAATLARLQATLACEEVVTLQTQCSRSRLPERMQRAVPIESPRQFMNRKPSTQNAAVTWAPALRLIVPPKSISAPQPQQLHAGPFRLSESWWENPVDRDYYQMIDHTGALQLIFFDSREGGWYVQGVFD